jgi:TPR repeat protein
LDAERAAATAPATPSFDCTTAKSGAARLICSDAELSKADADLGKAFHTSLARLEGADKSAAIKDQVQWIRVRNTRCGLNGKEDAPIDMLAAAKGCMLQAMQSRIQYFGGANVPAPPADQPQPTASGKTEAPKALQDGLAAIKDRDYATALHLLRPLADEGNADAQSQIGHMYAHGQGVANDDVEAVKRYRKAADQGNSEAQNNLGFMYHEGRGVANDDVEALKWFRKAADQGNAEGQFDLGNAYLNGWGVMQNFAEGEEWYRKAADQGLAQAKTSLALLPASREFNGWSKPFEVNCFDVANGTRVVIWDDLRKTPIWGQRFMSGGVQLESAADFDSLADQSKLARFVAVLYTSAAEYCQKEASAGKGVFTPNFGVILITPPYPYANWSAKVMWWSNGTTVSVIEPNISRFSKNIAEQLRSIRQNQAAYEQAQRDRAAQEARNAEIIQTNMYNFTSKTGVQQWINREELRSNAIRFKGQIVGVFAYFTQLESETEGIFGNSMLGATDTLIVTGIDATKLKKNQEVIMAVRVNGLRPHLSVQVPDLSLVGIAYCQQQHCSEFGNVPN